MKQNQVTYQKLYKPQHLVHFFQSVNWQMTLVVFFAAIFQIKGQTPTCLPVACGYLNVEICPISNNMSTCQGAAICPNVSDCNNVQYAVRLRLNPLYPYQNINMEYASLALTLRFNVITPSTPLGGLSHINVKATEEDCNNQWSDPTAIKVENNKVLFSLANEYNENTPCPTVDPLQFTNGVCHLFNVVITGYPGEVVNLACQELIYDSGGPFYCNNLCNNGANLLTIPTPALGTIDGSQNLELKLKEVNPGQLPRQVQVILQNNSALQPVQGVQYIDFALHAEYNQIFGTTSVLPGNPGFLSIDIVPELAGSSSKYSWFHVSALSASGFNIGINAEYLLCTLILPGPLDECIKGEVNLNILPDGARIRTNTACNKLPSSTDILTSKFGEYDLCDPSSPYGITITGNPQDYECNNTISANIAIKSNSSDPVSVYYLRMEVEFVMNGPVALTGIDESEWGVCPGCASYSGNTVTYLLDLDPVNAVTIDPGKNLKVNFMYGTNGSVQSFSTKCVALGIIDPVTHDPVAVCVPSFNASGFPLSPVSHQITGEIHTEPLDNNECIEEVTVTAVSQEPIPVGQLTRTTYTACIHEDPLDTTSPIVSPHYQVCIIPDFTKYRVTPVKDDNPLNGVSTFDLVLINKHVLGIEPLNSPYKMIAADANNSASITTFDVVELRKLILGIYTKLPANTSWRFVEEDFIFPNPANPFNDYGGGNTPNHEWLDVTPDFNHAPAAEANFIGIKIGDVNTNAVANALVGAPTTSVRFPKQFTDKGKYVTIPVTYTGDSPLEAYQLGLHFDPNLLEWAGVSPGNVPGYTTENFGFTQVRQGNIRTLWMADPLDPDQSVKPGAILFYLKFRVKRNVPESDQLLHTDDKVLPNQAWSKSGTTFAVTSGQVAEDRLDTPNAEAAFTVNCQPNPTNDAVRFNISGINSGKAVLHLYGAFGNMILDKETELHYGTNEINVQEVAALPAGVYLWQMRTPRGQTQGRLIKQ